MVKSKVIEERKEAASQLKANFESLNNKDQAWQVLIRLTKDEDSFVRWRATSALGSAFSHHPNKDRAWQDMIQLPKDKERGVRVSMSYSLGRASIFKAIEARNENEFKNELKNAVEFFEKSSREATYINPAQFCHPFYKSIYSISFKDQDVESESKKYLKVAKNATGGSEYKKILIEAIENLENALREVHKSREKGLEVWKSDLKAYR